MQVYGVHGEGVGMGWWTTRAVRRKKGEGAKKIENVEDGEALEMSGDASVGQR